MRGESIMPHKHEQESVYPEGVSIFGITEESKITAFVESLKIMLPTAKSDEEIVAMEVRAALEVSGTENLEQVAKVVTEAIILNNEVYESALMVAHRILKFLVQ